MALTKKDLKEMFAESEECLFNRMKIEINEQLNQQLGEQTNILETSFRNLLRFEIGTVNERIDLLTLSVSEAFNWTEKRLKNLESSV